MLGGDGKAYLVKLPLYHDLSYDLMGDSCGSQVHLVDHRCKAGHIEDWLPLLELENLIDGIVFHVV